MDEVTRLIQHAGAKLFQAQVQEAEAAAELAAEALDCLIKAEQLAPGSASWQLALLSAQKGDPDRCRKWMERAARLESLPSRSEVTDHPAMTEMKTELWFMAIVAELD